MPPSAPADPTPRALPHPGRGIVVISERESLGDGFYKLQLLRALKRAYPDEKITWIVSEGDSPYRTLMARIAAPLVDTLIVQAGLRRPWLAALLARRPTKVAAIALANKMARMVWVMMAKGERYKEPVALAA